LTQFYDLFSLKNWLQPPIAASAKDESDTILDTPTSFIGGVMGSGVIIWRCVIENQRCPV
jgi:hypothetical protein